MAISACAPRPSVADGHGSPDMVFASGDVFPAVASVRDYRCACKQLNAAMVTKSCLSLEVRYKDKSIADVLDMTVEEAADLFKAVPSIRDKMETLKRVGSSYVKVGQQATTLSGGEAQRVKLAKELSRRSTGRTLYILDEPTTGLHFHDVAQLLDVLHELVDQGNTMIVIEHNLEVVKTADWIVDMGPEGGDAGGEVVAQGTPEQISRNPKSYTGAYLKPVLTRKGAKRSAAAE
jgi:excinuclease ABC subunit A